ncbi:MAG: hypothetical protein ACJ8BC_01745 [Gemmatimonadales bacterium]|jgi:hypothetical protein
MSRTTFKRLEALERSKQPGGYDKVHQLTINEGKDSAPLIAALCASGEAKETDLFIVRVIIDPPVRKL